MTGKRGFLPPRTKMTDDRGVKIIRENRFLIPKTKMTGKRGLKTTDGTYFSPSRMKVKYVNDSKITLMLSGTNILLAMVRIYGIIYFKLRN